MLIAPPQSQPTGSSRMAEYCRSYVLFDGVCCNIPRWGSVGEPGAWNHARGLLAELTARLDATPIALHYRDLVTGGRARLPVGIEVTAVLRDPNRELVTVAHRCESAPYSAAGDRWRLTVNGEVPDGGHATYPPSLPRIAGLVSWYLQQQRPLGPLTHLDRARPA